MLNDKSKIKGGFTIAELIMVIGIIGVLAAIATNTYRNQRQAFQYTDSLTKVISTIKTARNYAVTSRAYWDGTANIVPVEGYGILIDKTAGTFKLFANVGGSINQYDSTDGDEETYTLPEDTIFDSLTLDGAATGKALIIFRPPIAETFIAEQYGASPPDPIPSKNELVIQFSRRGAPEGTEPKVIKINKIAGFPEIEF